jgi:hypothetical protein
MRPMGGMPPGCILARRPSPLVVRGHRLLAVAGATSPAPVTTHQRRPGRGLARAAAGDRREAPGSLLTPGARHCQV